MREAVDGGGEGIARRNCGRERGFESGGEGGEEKRERRFRHSKESRPAGVVIGGGEEAVEPAIGSGVGGERRRRGGGEGERGEM